MTKLVFTCGDINGIGPEIVLKALNKLSHQHKKSKYFLCIPRNVFRKISTKVNPEFDFKTLKLDKLKEADTQVNIILLPSAKLNTGKATKESGLAAYNSLKESFGLLENKIADAVVTAPVSKTAFGFAGINFPGQTELFAHWCKSKNFVMTFLSGKLNVALYSIHVPLKKVAVILSKRVLSEKINLIDKMLKNDLGIVDPKIAVLGLNPHAGEGGIIGNEEIDILNPTLKKLKTKINIEGPFSADAFFAKRKYKNFDLTLVLYHDQGLIPFKHINAGKGVNFTAGLPVIRTSPDHGVAYDIAWKGVADDSSIIEAAKYAALIARNRRKHSEAEN